MDVVRSEYNRNNNGFYTYIREHLVIFHFHLFVFTISSQHYSAFQAARLTSNKTKSTWIKLSPNPNRDLSMENRGNSTKVTTFSNVQQRSSKLSAFCLFLIPVTRSYTYAAAAYDNNEKSALLAVQRFARKLKSNFPSRRFPQLQFSICSVAFCVWVRSVTSDD